MKASVSQNSRADRHCSASASSEARWPRAIAIMASSVMFREVASSYARAYSATYLVSYRAARCLARVDLPLDSGPMIATRRTK